MKLLAIDTSSTACSVALLLDDDIKEEHQIAPMQQAKKILPMIKQLLLENNISLNQLDALAFGCGPGSFTGIRIATSVSQGLSFAAQLPVIPVSSLAALAQTVFMQKKWEKLLVAVDARMNEIYCGCYQVNDQGMVSLIGEEKICSPRDFPYPSGNDTWYGVGNGWEEYRLQLPIIPADIETSLVPKASAIALLAKGSAALPPGHAYPVYLRDQVAVKQKKS